MGSVRGPIGMPRDEGVLCFGSFKLDPVTRILRDGKGGDVTLRRSEYALLSALLTHAGRVLSRDQLRDAVSGRSAEAFDRSIDVLIGRLRRKLGEDSRSPELIKTVSGAGYRFAGSVRRTMHLDERCPVDAVSLILDTFEGAHGPEGYLIRQGLADELRLALGGAAPRVALIEPDLAGGVVIESVYRLRGSLWRSGNRTRVTAHLIDGAHGNILLSRRFDAQPGTDDFTFVEQTARSLAASVMARLGGASDQADSRRDFIENFKAGYASQSGLASAFEATRAAIAANEGDAQAVAFHAYLIAMKHSQSLGSSGERQQALDLAAKAVRISAEDPVVLRYAAHVYAYLGHDFRRSLELADRAMRLAPQSVDLIVGNAWAHTYACLPDQAITKFERALMLENGASSRADILSGLALAHFVSGDYAQALAWSERCITANTAWARPYRFAAISLAHMDKPQQAKLMGQRMMAVAPSFRISRQINPLRDADAANRFTRGLQAARLPM